MPSRWRSFFDQRPLELGKCPHHRAHQRCHGRVCAREGQVFLHEGHTHAAPSQLLHEAAQIVKVAGQPIHAMHHHRIALAHKNAQPIQLRALGSLPEALSVKLNPLPPLFQLTFRVLVEAADANIANPLTAHRLLLAKSVRLKSITCRGTCQ